MGEISQWATGLIWFLFMGVLAAALLMLVALCEPWWANKDKQKGGRSGRRRK